MRLLHERSGNMPGSNSRSCHDEVNRRMILNLSQDHSLVTRSHDMLEARELECIIELVRITAFQHTMSL